MFFEYFFVFLFSVLLPTKGDPLDPQVALQIDNFVEEILAANNIPSLSLAIVSQNGTHVKGFGLRNVEKYLTADEDTLFAIGSVTKQFTSLLIANELHILFPELGEKVLDTPIKKLAPEYPLILRDKYRTEEVTFRDLLAHRLCVPRNGFGFYYGTFNTTREMLYRERYYPEICAFRDGITTPFTYQYNNRMYALAWDIVESMTNKTFPDALDSFFDHTGMTRSTTIKATDSNDVYDEDNRAQAYTTVENNTYRAKVDPLKAYILVGPAGSIMSSAKDMLVYLQLQLNKGQINGTQIIPENVLLWPRMVSKVFEAGVFKNDNTPLANHIFGYGLGLWTEDYDGYSRIGHDGAVGFYSSYLNFYPQLGFGIFLSNSGGDDLFNLQTIGDGVFLILQAQEEVYLKPVKKDGNADLSQSPQQLQSLTAIKKKQEEDFFMPIERLPGKYGNAMMGDLEIYSIQTNITTTYRVRMGWNGNGQGTIERLDNSTFAVTLDEAHYGYPTGITEYFVFLNLDQFVIISQAGSYFEDALDIMERDFGISSLPSVPWENEQSSAFKAEVSWICWTLAAIALKIPV